MQSYKMSRNMVILLTACVNPNGMAFTKLQDVKARESQYRESLTFYLENSKEKILFVENSGYDISAGFEAYIECGRLEMLSFDGNSYDLRRGKGYGEALIILYALEHSQLLRKNSMIIKITGRLKCLNIQKVVTRCSDELTVYSILTKDGVGMECDSRVFVAPCSFLRMFLQNMEKLNDSKHYYFEHLLYDVTREWIITGHTFKEIWFPLSIQGISGSTGVVTNNRIKDVLSFYLHYISHMFGYYGAVNLGKLLHI